MAKDVGAKKVVVASCAPPIRFPNVYGIDMPSRKELVGHGRNEQEIAEAIGADLIIFQTLPDLVHSARQWNPKIEQFDCSVFTGQYITGGVDESYLEHIENLRADKAKTKMQRAKEIVQQNGGHRPKTAEEKEEVHEGVGTDNSIGLHNSFNTQPAGNM